MLISQFSPADKELDDDSSILGSMRDGGVDLCSINECHGFNEFVLVQPVPFIARPTTYGLFAQV